MGHRLQTTGSTVMTQEPAAGLQALSLCAVGSRAHCCTASGSAAISRPLSDNGILPTLFLQSMARHPALLYC